ncbi:Flavin-linked sulfhydryl oxidase of the mitochondrial IMS [Basidiobolus ranarum]|uniref:Sulfhydryl oxidase n=1 Tax=Basidiobolus ranarum TaxID=34480 RepID=A0ABR2X2W9_9FUNG
MSPAPEPTKEPPVQEIIVVKRPCRVCDAFKSWTKKERKELKTSENNSTTPTVETTPVEKIPPTKEKWNIECPPDKVELGRSTWTFLHTMAAYYPDKPSKEQQGDMNTFLDTFSKFYPCNWCANHLQGEMKSAPPKVDSRDALSLWLCQLHNGVNKLLKKPEFDCSKVDERWRNGPKDGSCD